MKKESKKNLSVKEKISLALLALLVAAFFLLPLLCYWINPESEQTDWIMPLPPGIYVSYPLR